MLRCKHLCQLAPTLCLQAGGLYPSLGEDDYMSGHKLYVSSKITDPAGILHVGDLEYMCKTKSAVALPGGAGWSGRWMRWAGPVLPGGFFLCASPQAGNAGCELTHVGSAVEPGSALSRWSCRSVTGRRLVAVSAQGKAKCAAALELSPFR